MSAHTSMDSIVVRLARTGKVNDVLRSSNTWAVA
jgi:hypothetical protein